jgi:hypothetical protein
MKQYIKWIIFIVICLIYCSKEGNPREPIQVDRFVQLYVELYHLREKYPDPHVYSDSSQSVFQKYNFDKNKYDRTIAYYNQNPKAWSTFYKKVIDELQKRSGSDSSLPSTH